MEEKDKKIIIYICAGCIGIILILAVIGFFFGVSTDEERGSVSPQASPTTIITTTPTTTIPTIVRTSAYTAASIPKSTTVSQNAVSRTSGVCDCSSDKYNCGDLGRNAQACFDYCKSIGRGDVHNLDRDGDGFVCES